MLLKTGVQFTITRQGSLDTVARGRQVIEKKPETTSEFIYFATRAIAGDKPNGNGDYFPWDHLLKSYTSFIGRNLFLNHNSGDPRNAIGKVLDAYPVVDPSSNEKYIECLAKIDAVAHPELARQIQSGILDSCSMGCSVESSQCSVCGHTIYSDQDNKCRHMSSGLGKEFTSELDFPEANIKKGDAIQAYAINRGLNFTELSVVNVPAWDNAKIVQVIAKLKERVAHTSPETVKDLEDILQMASQNNLEKPAEATPAATPTPELKTPAEDTRESRLAKIFKEKLSALDFLDLQAYITKKEVEKVAHDVPAPASAADATALPEAAATTVPATTPTETASIVEASKEEAAQEKKDVANLEKAEAIIEEVKASEKKELAELTKAAAPNTTAEATPATATEATAVAEATPAAEATTETPTTTESAQDSRKLKAIFVSKANFKDSYWVVTDGGKPVLKASLGDIWGDKIADVQDYAASPVYGEALLQRLREDGVKKVALLTNATIYTESADARGQVGKGEEWPSQKSVGNSQYKPAGDMGKAKMKTLAEGVDMSGGERPSAQTGPSAGAGDQAAASKSHGKNPYKPAGYGGGPKAKTEKASSEEADIVKEAAAPMDMLPTDAPAAPEGMPAAMDAAEMPMGDKGPAAPMKPVSEMSAEERLALMKELVEAMDPTKTTAKPLAAVEKAVEKLDTAMTKEQEAAAKEAEKAQAAADKEAEKAAKAAEKEKKDEPKEEPKKEEKAEDKKEDKKEEKAEDKKEEKAEDKKEDKKEEGMEKTAEVAAETPATETPAVVAEAPTIEAEIAQAISSRERELEAQLMQLKVEQSLRAKTARCQTIVNEMIDKDLISADDSDIQAEISNGKPLFDARTAAFKTAVDKQCRDLLSMEEPTLQAFAQTVKRVKGRTIPSGQGVLKKAFKLSVDEFSGEESWLGDVFNSMGSQKKPF